MSNYFDDEEKEILVNAFKEVLDNTGENLDKIYNNTQELQEIVQDLPEGQAIRILEIYESTQKEIVRDYQNIKK